MLIVSFGGLTLTGFVIGILGLVLFWCLGLVLRWISYGAWELWGGYFLAYFASLGFGDLQLRVLVFCWVGIWVSDWLWVVGCFCFLGFGLSDCLLFCGICLLGYLVI